MCCNIAYHICDANNNKDNRIHQAGDNKQRCPRKERWRIKMVEKV